MPRKPKPPPDGGRTRAIRIHTVYYALLWEVCERIGFKSETSTLTKCLEYIIKDLYDTVMSEASPEAQVKEREVRVSEVEERHIRVRVPPPPP
jgi:hypothetical protein